MHAHLQQQLECQPKQSQRTGQKNDLNQNNMKKQLDPSNHSYFQLIQLVGSKGKYQKYSLIIWCMIWFLGGQLLLGTPFLLYNPAYQNCPPQIPQPSCPQYVCTLSPQDRTPYLPTSLTTLANQFNDYNCQQSIQIQIATTLIYFGSCLGYIVVSLLNDNVGRKRSILIAFTMSTIGIVAVTVSQNLLMAEIGLFVTGFGIDSSINTALYFISQTVENSSRQKYSVIIQSFFSLGGIANLLYYLIFKNWRIIFCIFFLIPSIIVLFLISKFIQQTPQFLIMFYSVQQCIQSLKKIANTNQNSYFLQTPQNQKKLFHHIQTLKQSYSNRKQLANKTIFTPLDLFRFKSIRSKTFCAFILSFSIYLMYYGPLMLIEKYKMNVFISTLVVVSSQIIVYPIFYVNVKKMKRKLWAAIFFISAIICATLLSFLIETEDQFWKIVQMVLIFLFRFSISFQFALFLIYCSQLFPSQLRGLGIGFSSALGTIASTSSPLLFGQLNKIHFPVMTIFIAFGLMSLACTYFLPETKGKKLSEQIQQFKQFQMEKRTQIIQENKKKSNQQIQQKKDEEYESPVQKSLRENQQS